MALVDVILFLEALLEHFCHTVAIVLFLIVLCLRVLTTRKLPFSYAFLQNIGRFTYLVIGIRLFYFMFSMINYGK